MENTENYSEKKPKLREKYEKMTLPLGKALAKLRLTPNMLTVMSALIALGSLYYLYFKKDLLIGFAIFLFAVFFDIFDGSLARATGMMSSFGKVLDHFTDRFVEFTFIIGLVLGEYIPGWLGTFVIFSMIAPSYVRARGEAELKVSGMSVGFYERKEKIITLIIGVILELYYYPGALYYACLIVAVFSFITAIQRLLYYRRVWLEKRKKTV